MWQAPGGGYSQQICSVSKSSGDCVAMPDEGSCSAKCWWAGLKGHHTLLRSGTTAPPSQVRLAPQKLTQETLLTCLPAGLFVSWTLTFQLGPRRVWPACVSCASAPSLLVGCTCPWAASCGRRTEGESGWE